MRERVLKDNPSAELLWGNISAIPSIHEDLLSTRLSDLDQVISRRNPQCLHRDGTSFVQSRLNIHEAT